MQVCILGDHKSKTYRELHKYVAELGYQDYAYTVSNKVTKTIENFRKVQNLIVAADVVIADESVLEPGFNYQLALSIQYRRPTILFVDSADKVEGLKARNLNIEVYKNIKDTKKIIERYVEKVKGSLDAKLFMNIPSSMNKYLDWVATHTRFSKSDIVREAVDKVAQKDKDYQDFLRDLDKF